LQICRFRSGALTGFMPVSMAPTSAALPALVAAVEVASKPRAIGLVEVELPSGIKLRITGDVEPDALRRILSALP
jgi:transposase